MLYPLANHNLRLIKFAHILLTFHCIVWFLTSLCYQKAEASMQLNLNSWTVCTQKSYLVSPTQVATRFEQKNAKISAVDVDNRYKHYTADAFKVSLLAVFRITKLTKYLFESNRNYFIGSCFLKLRYLVVVQFLTFWQQFS